MLCAPELRDTKGEDKDMGNPGESKKSKNVELGLNPQPVRMRLTALPIELPTTLLSLRHHYLYLLTWITSLGEFNPCPLNH